jgi:hypothetical protein
MTLSFGWIIWLVIIALELFLVGVCNRFKTRDSLPWFWRYLAFTAMKSVVLFFVAWLTLNSVLYGYMKCVFDAASAGLLLFVAREIWLRVFGPKIGLPDKVGHRARTIIVIAYPACLLIGVLFRLDSPKDWFNFIVNFQFISNSSLAATLVLMMGYSRRLGITWRPRIAGIATGMVVMMLGGATTSLLASAGVNLLALQTTHQSIGVIALVWWGVVLWGKEHIPEKATREMVDVMLREHNKSMGVVRLFGAKGLKEKANTAR